MSKIESNKTGYTNSDYPDVLFKSKEAAKSGQVDAYNVSFWQSLPWTAKFIIIGTILVLLFPVVLLIGANL